MRPPNHFLLPLSRKIRNMRNDHERESLRALYRQTGAQEKIAEITREVSSGKVELAAQLPAMMMQMLQDQRPDADSEEREMREVEREDLAYGFAHLYFDRGSGGSFALVDFAAILDGMESIFYNPTTQSYLVTRLEGDTTELKGTQAQAFYRYLTFLGLFEAISLRKNCPVCAPDEAPGVYLYPHPVPGMDPQNPERRCPECNGLAWVLEDGTAVES